MTRTLLIRLPLSGDAPLTWSVAEDGVLGASGALAAGERADPHLVETADRIIALLPGTEVLLCRVELPARSESQARAALPFLLEDDLAVEPDTCHFALGAAGEDGRRPVAAVARKAMDGWLGRLAGAGLRPSHCVPDMLALFAPPGAATAVDLGSHVAVATGPTRGFAAEPEMIGHVLGGLLANADIARLRLYSDRPAVLMSGAPPAGLEVETEAPLGDEALAAMMHGRLAGGVPLDLLQGAYANRAPLSVRLGALRRVAALAALAALAYGALMMSQAWRYDRLADRSYEQAEAVFRQAVPSANRVVNPRSQIAAELDRLRSARSDRYLQLANLLYGVLSTLNAVELVSLRYDAARGELFADLAYESFADIEAVRSEITQRGGVLEEGGSRQSGGRVVGGIVIRLAR